MQRNTHRRSMELLAAVVVTVAAGCGAPAAPPETARVLSDGWQLCAAAQCGEDGGPLSLPEHETAGWLPGRVPTTVMAAQVAHGMYPDLFVGTNLEDVDGQQFEGPWWYRTEVTLSGDEAKKTARLVFEGINYSAEVWLNGRQVAGRDRITGAYRTHEVDATGALHLGQNVLAVKVFPPRPGDFTVGFVDWNPRPPDNNMGIWRPVLLRLTGPVSVDDVVVRSDVDEGTLRSADLEVSATVTNHGAEPVTATVRGAIEDISFARELTLAAGEQLDVRFTPQDVPALHVEGPRLWWPHTLGEPELYTLSLRAIVGGRRSDASQTTFGIREVATYMNPEGHRGFTVNGVPVLIRGGGWVDDLLLDGGRDRIEAQLAYVKHMGLNAVRLEGFWGSGQDLYDIADREGILLMAGWSCQWEWEDYLGKPVDERYGGVLSEADQELVTASLRDQVRWLRNHPSIFTWALASDLVPHPDLERRYRAMLAATDPTRPALVSTGWKESEVSGPSGVKMNGPYDWVPPRYWYEDTEHGGAYGFNTETGPGPQPPPLESVRRMMPREHLWPIDDVWDYHCARNEFNTMDRFVTALDRRYGPSSSVEEFLRKAQAASYEAMRPMFESFAVRRPLATGVIQWMLNSAWPAMYWQLYDAYLMPNGAFYGARAACRPTTLAYDYQERAVYAVNDTRAPVPRARAWLRVLDLEGHEVLRETREVALGPGSSRRVFELGSLEPPTPVYFVALRLDDEKGKEMARNFYWLSTTRDVLDWQHSEWFVTPTKSYADFTALADLPEVRPEVEAAVAREGRGAEVKVRLANLSGNLGFFVELRIVDPATGVSILPVLWDDNYVSILPGEERLLVAHLPDLGGATTARLVAAGFNVPELPVDLDLGARSAEGEVAR